MSAYYILVKWMEAKKRQTNVCVLLPLMVSIWIRLVMIPETTHSESSRRTLSSARKVLCVSFSVFSHRLNWKLSLVQTNSPIESDCGLFSPLVQFVWASVNTVITLGCKPKQQLCKPSPNLEPFGAIWAKSILVWNLKSWFWTHQWVCH